MSKTAVQQGIEKLWVLYQNTNSPKEKGELSAIITTFEFLLEVEKQQIENAFDEGKKEQVNNSCCDTDGNIYFTSEKFGDQYFTDTYDK